MRYTRHNSIPGAGRAFTLVEMLVVIFIIALVVAILAGVGKAVFGDSNAKLTRQWQATIMNAVETYWNVYHAYPDQSYIPAPPQPPDYSGIWGDRYMGASAPANTPYGWQVYWRSHSLYLQLTRCPDTLPTLQSLPPDAVCHRLVNGYDDSNPPKVGTVSLDSFVDAWGTFMDYQAAGSMGGKPVLISAGEGKNYLTSVGSWDNPGYGFIRSDGR
ncbi:MAG: type II secretion system protein [Phycisphaerae bacterium]